jgi:hypothetical protein
MDIVQNLQINLVSCLYKRLLHLHRYDFDLLPTSSTFFHEKIQLFVTLKSYQDPEPQRFGSLDLDPDPH